MTSSQCLAGSIWLMSAFDAFERWGWPGLIIVLCAAGLSAVAVFKITNKMRKGMQTHDA